MHQLKLGQTSNTLCKRSITHMIVSRVSNRVNSGSPESMSRPADIGGGS